MDHRVSTSGSSVGASNADSRTMLFEIQKNSRERIRVCLSRYRGNEYVEARVWFVAPGGEYQPSRHGFMLKPQLVAQLIQGLELAARAADPQGAR